MLPSLGTIFIFIILKGVEPFSVKCPPRWEGFSESLNCYRMYTEEQEDWDTAEQTCTNQGGSLVNIESQPVKDYIASRAGESKESMWIGLRLMISMDGELKWKWSNGEEYTNTFISWAPGEPVVTTAPACAGIDKDGNMFASKCDGEVKAFMCERYLGAPQKCPTSWTHYGFNCYKTIDEDSSKSLDFWGAREECKKIGGDLPIQLKHSSNKYLYSLAKEYESDLWIGITENENGNFSWVDGSPIDESDLWLQNSDEHQPMNMNGSARGSLLVNEHGSWATKPASASLRYVCQQTAGFFCLDGMVEHDIWCYTFEINPEKDLLEWPVANNECTKLGMSLPVFNLIDTSESEWYNSKLLALDVYLEQVNAGFWIGAKETMINSEKFEWVNYGGKLEDGYDARSDDITYNPLADDCLWFAPCGGSENVCNPITTENKRWLADKCESNKRPYYYGCQILVKETVNLTGIFNVKKYCLEGWTLFDDECYKMGDTEETWASANTWCKEVNDESDLVSLSSLAENDFVSNLISKEVSEPSWIGYNKRSGEWKWTDGTSPTQFYHWASDEDPQDSPNNCAVINSNNVDYPGDWVTESCTQLHNFVCKMPSTEDPSGNPSLPDTTESPENPNCGHHHGWVEDPVTGMCYHFLETPLAWEDAKEECKSMSGYGGDGDLASINSFMEQSFVQGFIQNEGGKEGRWIGLADLGTERVFRWSDGTPISYVNWNDGEPNSYYDNEDCVVIIPSLGSKWNDERCDILKKSVCERKGHNYKPPPTPSPPEVSCEPGWEVFEDKCYYFSGSVETISNVTTGNIICEALNPVATLASIASQAELDFVLEHMQRSSYIGASDSHEESVWTWYDGTPWGFTNWGTDEPNGGPGENCLEIVNHSRLKNTRGWWNDIDCEDRGISRGYICSYNNKVCPDNWRYWNKQCWFSSTEKTDYETAKKECSDVSSTAKLASIHDITENWFLSELEKDSSFIGLQKGANEKWIWNDGTDVSFDGWDENQPAGAGNCAVLRKDGKWNTEDCVSEQYYDCKFTASAYYGCPIGWSLAKGWCYLLQDDDLQWEDAVTACKAKGGDLVSIQSYSEQEEVFALINSGPPCPENFIEDSGICVFVSPYLLTWAEARSSCLEAGSDLFMVKSAADQAILKRYLLEGEELWLGGTDEQDEGSWVWVDGTPFMYFNWEEGNIDTDGENCALNRGETNHWVSRNCSEIHAYVCSRPTSKDKTRWIGLSDKSSLQTFEWSDKNPMIYSNWGVGMPNTYGELPVCAYINTMHGDWMHTECSESKASVCKTNSEITGPPPDVYGCLEDEVAYKDSCYRFDVHFTSYYESEKTCKGWGGQLLDLQSEYEQAKITTFVADLEIHFWVGLKYNNATQSFEWSSGEPVEYTHWAEYEPDFNHAEDDGSGFCAYMHRHEDIGFWKVIRCSKPMASICEFPRQGYTEPPTTTTTIRPEAQCPSYEWIKYNDHCYRAFEAYNIGNGFGYSFEDARKFCQSQGGDLITIGDYDEDYSTVQSQYIYGTYYIGLRANENEDNELEYSWIDNTPLSYLNWGYSQPDTHEGRELCIAYDFISAFAWRNYNCEERLGVICESVAGIEAPTTVDPPTPPPRIPCGNGLGEEWFRIPEIEDMCYAIYQDFNSQGKTFRQAEDDCAKQGAHLASIHTHEENYYLRSEIEFSNVANVWIGLTSLNLDDGYEWTDGTPAEYLAWGENEPNNALDQESCASMDSRNGYWNDARCNIAQSWICKRPKDGEYTTEASTAYPSGHCPKDWLEFEGRCYKIFGDETSYSNWTTARETCKSLSITRRHKGELASIHSDLQTAFLVAESAKYPENAYWIGLNMLLSWGESLFTWSDETDVDFTNWDQDEPNGAWYYEYCVQMYGFKDSPGKWNDADCDAKTGFICEALVSDNIPTESPADWIPCSKAGLGEKGFIELHGNCFKFESESKSWEEAEAVCKNYGDHVHLTSLMNKLEEDILVVLSHPEDFWVGLKKEENTWKWTDGWPVEYTNWYNTEFENGTCAFVTSQGGHWFQEDCSKNMKFACKHIEDDPPTPPPPTYCLDGWYGFQDKCYLASDYVMDMASARQACWQFKNPDGTHGDLLSLHSAEQTQAVMKYVYDMYPNLGSVWIGLSRSGEGFEWTDESPFDFENWYEGEPNDGYESEDCVDAIGEAFTWNDVFCSQYTAYVCMLDQETPTTAATAISSETPGTSSSAHTKETTTERKTTEHTTHRETTKSTTEHHTDEHPTTTTVPDNQGTTQSDNTTDSGMGGGAIAAIVLFVIILCTISAVLVVQLRENNWDWRRMATNARARSSSMFRQNGTPSFPNMAYNSGSSSVKTS